MPDTSKPKKKKTASKSDSKSKSKPKSETKSKSSSKSNSTNDSKSGPSHTPTVVDIITLGSDDIDNSLLFNEMAEERMTEIGKHGDEDENETEHKHEKETGNSRR